MGCRASKLDNEDTVRRCQERLRFMKACHHLAGAHADYCRSLRLTGSSLVSFETLSISDQTPAVFLHVSLPPPLSATIAQAAVVADWREEQRSDSERMWGSLELSRPPHILSDAPPLSRAKILHRRRVSDGVSG